MKLDLILHPTDFSESARRALEQAILFGRTFGARLHLLHKVVYPSPFVPRQVMEHPEDADRLEGLMKEYVEAAGAKARQDLDALSAETRSRAVEVTDSLITSGDPQDAILEHARKQGPDLIVMGTHGRTGAARLLIGSVAEQVLRHAPCQVMTLRAESAVAGAEGGLGPVLVPVDFSDFSQRALATARFLAERSRGALLLLHVVEPLHSPFHAGGFLSRLANDPSLAAKYREALLSMLAGFPGEVVVAEGHVAATILDTRTRHSAPLVVMGTHGRSGIRHFLHGSVAEKVTRFCEAPVWTVK